MNDGHHGKRIPTRDAEKQAQVVRNLGGWVIIEPIQVRFLTGDTCDSVSMVSMEPLTPAILVELAKISGFMMTDN